MATEKRLIEANALQSKICGAKCGCAYEDCGCEGDCQFDFFISNAPTVDAVEVVYGRWEWDVESHGDPLYGIDEDYGYRCSKCNVWADEYGVDGDIYGEPPTHILHYCPNCGAKMDGDGNG